ncbi:aliphatic sulfonate ABC transporter substrate-binding protein [Limnoglobus roseus]|uniref:Putative aliphatic sulfonates-binding protein n=1 Tax=Limnoglobus roseus TaxID=2598579 RepID=A0A5C1ADT0_9BACT|nr:aliphatic sulfonate ABC transporter substrate-binding protein [Limnoglobus roseus]QEL16337.1 aliphatic sulfonate ABC transporter substrate-binding protein [Limnoglobus roseus]
MRPRRISVLLAVWVALGLVGCRPADGPDRTLRVGYQKWGTYSILKASGTLEPKLAAHGYRVEWVEFPAGPPLLEAMNAGSLDLGHTGDSPPLFAQAAGVPLVYVAASSPSPDSSAVVVPAGSSIRGGAELKGKRVGFVKGSSAHTLVVRVLEKNGLGVGDIEAVYLSPADGRVALETGGIDAWSVWDPYLAAAEQIGTVRRAVEGRGLVEGREYYLAARSFVDSRQDIVRLFLAELTQVKGWARDRSDDVARMLADETGIDLGAIAKAEARRSRYDTRAITPELVAAQQALADRYVELGLLPKSIVVADAVPRIDFGLQE